MDSALHGRSGDDLDAAVAGVGDVQVAALLSGLTSVILGMNKTVPIGTVAGAEARVISVPIGAVLGLRAGVKTELSGTIRPWR